MSPTVFRHGPVRFFFFSREEPRIHIHVLGPSGEAKFWMEPVVSCASHTELPGHELLRLQRIIEEHREEILNAWHRHFPG
ncbi:MAG TPA: DUF4160 domain-containing protein [Treponema sp.]|nr:DUF4160 domain-containing protein [Treponema sp.]